MSDVEIIDDTVEEVTVYGNDGGGGHDLDPGRLLRLLRRRRSAEHPSSPPTPAAEAGGDVPTVEETVDVLTYAGAGFGVAGMLIGGPVGTAIGIVGVLYGLAAYEQSGYAQRSAAPDYQRPAGSTIAPRAVSLPAGSRDGRAVAELVELERASAVFGDAMDCTRGALLAGDAAWTQRHALAATDAYDELGQALVHAAGTLQGQAHRLRAASAQSTGASAQLAKRLPALLADLRPVLGLSPADEAHVSEAIVPLLPKGVPSDAAHESAARTLRKRGSWLTNPAMINVRFVFVAGSPPVT